MKIAIWSDLHIGRRMYRTDENNYNKYEQAGYRALTECTNAIINERPDLLINAGDIFETANPSVLAMNKYAQAQRKFENENIPTMTILGNHDFSFPNRASKCSAPAMAHHTYFADYEIKTVIIKGILFIMMPYIYDTDDNIAKYLEQCENIARESTCEKKILVTHGVTEKYYKDHFISDHIMLSDSLVELFNLVIIGHIHTPFAYIQKNTLVLSPGGMIDYQADTDRTGPCIIDTDSWSLRKIKIKTPHIIKVNCTPANINDVLKNVTEDIYHITYKGDTNAIDNDLFIEAKNNTINLVIDVVEDVVEEKVEKKLSLDIFKWVAENYPDYVDSFDKAKEALV